MKKVLFLAILMIACVNVSAKRVSVWLYFDDVTNHVYEDENVKVFMCPHLVVINKTNKVIYVDKGSSFLYTNGKAENMYHATSTASGTTYTTGASVNPGAIAYALGARGPLVTALSATTYSNSESYTSSIISHEKRFIPIAPMSSEVVLEVNLFVSLPKWPQGDSYKNSRLIEHGTKTKIAKGLTRQYTKENSILSYKCLVSYSFTEDTNNLKEATVENYLKELIVDKRKAKRGEVQGQTLVQQAEDGTKWGSNWGYAGGIVGITWASIGVVIGAIFLAI